MNEAKSHSVPTYLDTGGEGKTDDGTGIWPPPKRPHALGRLFERLRELLGSSPDHPSIDSGEQGKTDDGTGIMPIPEPDDRRSATKPGT